MRKRDAQGALPAAFEARTGRGGERHVNCPFQSHSLAGRHNIGVVRATLWQDEPSDEGWDNTGDRSMIAKRLVCLACVPAALTLFAGASAFAQSAGEKIERVERDNREIRRDTTDIRRDKGDIRRDERKLKEERRERNEALRKEERAVERGDLKAAKKWDARRREEQKDVNAAKRDLRRDKADLAKDRSERRKDIDKRNRDASKL